MLNYLKMFVMQILPSVAATIIGAYIVNHYIAPRPDSDASAASSASIIEPKADPKADVRAAATSAPDAKPAETAGNVSNLPEAGVKAKGISEKALLEKNAASEKAVVEKPAAEKPAEKDRTADKPAEVASIPAEPRRHQPAAREKTAVRVIPLTPQPAAPTAVVAAPASAAETAVAPEERRDANDLARAAIDRLRSGDNAPRTQAASRGPEVLRNPEGTRISETPSPVTAHAMRPLPPPIMVSAPPTEAVDPPAPQRPPYATNDRADDPIRPTPPAEIPTARPPLDLRAEIAPPREKTSVADDVLSAAKSVFHSVLPK